MEKLIPNWAVSNKEGCSCKDHAKKWDKMGIEECEAKSEKLVSHLVSQSDRLIPAFKAVPAIMKNAIARGMVAKAIKRAKASRDANTQ